MSLRLKSLGLDRRTAFMFALKECGIDVGPLKDNDEICIDEDGMLFRYLDLDDTISKLYELVPEKSKRYELAAAAYEKCTNGPCKNCGFRKTYSARCKWCIMCYEEVNTYQKCACLYTLNAHQQTRAWVHQIECKISERCREYIEDVDKKLTIKHCLASGTQIDTDLFCISKMTQKFQEMLIDPESAQTPLSKKIGSLSINDAYVRVTEFEKSSVKLAQYLLGKFIIRVDEGSECISRIVETEAYCGVTDVGSLTFGGKKILKTKYAYGTAGTVFIYVAQNRSCLNICSKEDGGYVLVRSVEPVKGVGEMHKRRNAGKKREIKGISLCNGPYKTCSAMNIGPSENGTDLKTSRILYLGDDGSSTQSINQSSRVPNNRGSCAQSGFKRFYIRNSGYVSAEVLDSVPVINTQ